MSALGVLVFFVLFCFVGPLVLPHQPDRSSNPLSHRPAARAASHLLGTDEHGFDELGRIMVGGQTALEIGFFAALIATVIGTLYGAIAGLVGGVVDGVMMRFVDILLSIPFLFIVLVLATKYSATVLDQSLLLGLFSWLVPARLVRGEVLTLRERDFVSAARVMGSDADAAGLPPPDPERAVGRDRQRHLPGRRLDPGPRLPRLPRLRPAVSRRRRGATCSATPQSYVTDGYWWLVYPVGVCLVAVVMACNLVGDALRDAFDVRLRRR